MEIRELSAQEVMAVSGGDSDETIIPKPDKPIIATEPDTRMDYLRGVVDEKVFVLFLLCRP